MTRAYKKRRIGQSDHDKKTIEKKGRFSYVPQEIQRQILVRLPVKSLLRFCTLNKWSHSLISTQQFIIDHLITFRHENKRQFLLVPPTWSNSNCQHVDGSIRPVYVQDLAPPPSGLIGEKIFGDHYRAFCYCDGVVCMIDKWLDIQLWNPSIRKITQIVGPGLHNFEFSFFNDKRFRFGSIDGEHKVVVFSMAKTSISAYVFSLKTRNWANVKGQLYVTWTSGRSVFVNGTCHWLARGGGGPFVLSFNLKEHRFGKIDLPNYVGSAFDLSAYDGCLSFIACMGRGRSAVWVMTKYGVVESWVRIMENKSLTYLQDIVGIKGGDAFRLAWCWNDRSKTKLVYYKPTRQRAELLKADFGNLMDLHAYQESLVSLNLPKYVWHAKTKT